jgi:hypothetical protein
MRLSALVVSILLVSITLFGQHTSGTGAGGGFSGSSNAGASHSGYSSGFSLSAGSASSHSSGSSGSHVTGTSPTASNRASSSKVSSSKENVVKQSAPTETKSSRSFFHPFRKPKPIQSTEFKRPAPCFKGSCAVCPPGELRSGKGACMIASNSCSAGQTWNGFACSTQPWFNNCRALADQLAAQEQQMRGQNDPGQSLRHQQLRNQYEQCLRRFSLEPFGSYAFNGLRLDIP